jgi:hypothetical protein
VSAFAWRFTREDCPDWIFADRRNVPPIREVTPMILPDHWFFADEALRLWDITEKQLAELIDEKKVRVSYANGVKIVRMRRVATPQKKTEKKFAEPPKAAAPESSVCQLAPDEITSEEAHEITKLGVAYLLKLVRQGRIKGEKRLVRGKRRSFPRWVLSRSDVEAYHGARQ